LLGLGLGRDHSRHDLGLGLIHVHAIIIIRGIIRGHVRGLDYVRGLIRGVEKRIYVNFRLLPLELDSTGRETMDGDMMIGRITLPSGQAGA
jgi:hypothetical protein